MAITSYANTAQFTVKRVRNLHGQTKDTKARLHVTVRTLGPVVQSIVSLTSLLRGQLVKYFTTLLLNTVNFFVEKMREAFALQKLLALFQQKILANSRY